MKYFYIQHRGLILLRLPPISCLLTASVTNTVIFVERIIIDMVLRLCFWSLLIVDFSLDPIILSGPHLHTNANCVSKFLSEFA